LAAAGVVSAAIDISDGFAGDLARLCDASGVGAEVDASAWPRDAVLARAAESLGVTLDALRFGPGDDYELLLALRPAVWAARGGFEGVTVVGAFTAGAGAITLRDAAGVMRSLPAHGFDHFAGG